MRSVPGNICGMSLNMTLAKCTDFRRPRGELPRLRKLFKERDE